ncbi:hypothetical protein [Anaerocolumna sp.]|uniref:hypothetical protein n=1 Tax=Anaerocolumna sp. TaxID=2041569 RepID=UPI0028A6CFAF|nr:hypothetical protein [Anaerocolumna sp.]
MNATTKSKGIDLSRKITVDTAELQQILSVGRSTAVRIGCNAGAKVVVGKRVLWYLKKIDQYLDKVDIVA